MSEQEPILKIDFIRYALAWIKYAGELLVRVSNIGNVIRDNFADLTAPEREDYVNTKTGTKTG